MILNVVKMKKITSIFHFIFGFHFLLQCRPLAPNILLYAHPVYIKSCRVRISAIRSTVKPVTVAIISNDNPAL